MELLNIFNSGGLWLLPFIVLFAGIFCLYKAYQQSKSNSTTQVNKGQGVPGTIHDNTGNVPIYKLGLFYWGVALVAVSIYMFFAIGSDYRGV